MTQRRSEIIQDIGLCLFYVESFAAMQFSTVDLVLWSEILDFSWTLIFDFLMPVYISGSYWKIFKGNVYQNYYDKFRAQTTVSLLIFDSDGWVDCWTTSNVAISIGYNYHPMPVLLQQAPSDEESLTAPLRPSKYLHLQPPDNFDPGEMDSDLIAVELEVAPSMLCVYGSLLRNFLHVKVTLLFFWFPYSIY